MTLKCAASFHWACPGQLLLIMPKHYFIMGEAARCMGRIQCFTCFVTRAACVRRPASHWEVKAQVWLPDNQWNDSRDCGGVTSVGYYVHKNVYHESCIDVHYCKTKGVTWTVKTKQEHLFLLNICNQNVWDFFLGWTIKQHMQVKWNASLHKLQQYPHKCICSCMDTPHFPQLLN